MTNPLKTTFLLTVQAAALITSFAASAQNTDKPNSWPISDAVETETGLKIPIGAYGVAQINAPRVATLLQLRGVMGRGIVILRSGESADCLTVPIRFVAGDFGGDNISFHGAGPIRLIIKTPRVAKALARGDDVVSDMFRVSNSKDDAKADIIIQSGLSESHGFVLNPGRSVAADLFGAKISHMACSKL